MKSKQSVLLKCQASKQWTYIVKENENEVDYEKLRLKKADWNILHQTYITSINCLIKKELFRK